MDFNDVKDLRQMIPADPAVCGRKDEDHSGTCSGQADHTCTCDRRSKTDRVQEAGVEPGCGLR